MKPLVYFDFEEYDGDSDFVLVDKNRLQEILEEVYNAGFADGNKASQHVVPLIHDNWRYPIRGDEVTCGEVYTNTPAPKRGVKITCDTGTTSKS